MSRAAQRARMVLRRFHGPWSEVVDVEGILERERVEVSRWPLGETISGVLLREPRAIIAVNAAHHRNRQRFTMAHEYYHYLYHRSLNRLVRFTDLQDERQCEREANRFAACLLMPERTVRDLLRRYDLDDPILGIVCINLLQKLDEFFAPVALPDKTVDYATVNVKPR